MEKGTWDYEKNRNDLALGIASAYLTVLLNREIMGIAEFNVTNTRTQSERIARLVEAGQLAPGSLDQINSQLASDQSVLVSARNNYHLARLSLMQQMQLEEELQDNFDVEIPDLGEVSAEDIIANPEVAVQSALANFPEVRSAQTGLASAEIAESIARGGRYPRLTASYSYGTGYSGASRLLTGSADSLQVPIGTVIGSNDMVLSFPQPVFSDEDYTVKPFGDQLSDNINKSLFFNLTIPLFNGFSTDVNVRRAAINRLNAELVVDQTKQVLQQSVERAYADAQAALASYEASRISREASERAFGWAESRYDQGLNNQAEYADARNKLDVARATEVRSKYDYVFKVKVLEFYQGKPITLKR
jgi:outer membrane protein